MEGITEMKEVLKMTKAAKTIRGLDEALYQKARIAAIQEGVTLGVFFNNAIELILLKLKDRR